MTTVLTLGEVLDLLSRSQSVIEESDGADEHGELLSDLRAVTSMLREEIGGSHMGCGADVVILESADVE